MTDFRQLCAELAEKLDDLNCNYNIPSQSALVDRARTALAEPQGEGPSIDDIWQLCADHEFHLGIDGAYEDESANGLLRIVTEALFRWGRPAPPPADDGPAVPESREPASVDQQATAGELLQAYQAGRRDAEADERWAADVAQDLPADGEVRELVAALQSEAVNCTCSTLTSGDLRRAADLLTRLALQPFTRAQLLKLQDVLSTHQDEGPPGEGWASPELAALRAIVDELCDNHSTSENVLGSGSEESHPSPRGKDCY